MSIATTSLKYGWKVLALLTVGTGSIFVADNVLNRITTKDRIEVTLAVVERCYGTQYGTNAAGEPVYAVDPPSIVRTWTDTNGASVIMTNAIAWRDDLSMKVELDAKIEALCPYFVDTNSVYDGSTNIIMHTFTGLLTSLDLGDHTNFTAIPAIGTNAATYGPWAWRNYVVAWQERYKVLEALKMTETGVSTEGNTRRSDWQPYWVGFTWIAACTNREGYFNTDNAQNPSESSDGLCGYSGEQSTYWTASISSSRTKVSPSFVPTNLTAQTTLFLIYPTSFNNPYYNPTYYVTNVFTFDDNGYGLIYQTWNAIGSGTNVYFGDMRLPNRCDAPAGPFGDWNCTSRGFAYSFKAILTWQFNYCANKYW